MIWDAFFLQKVVLVSCQSILSFIWWTSKSYWPGWITKSALDSKTLALAASLSLSLPVSFCPLRSIIYSRLSPLMGAIRKMQMSRIFFVFEIWSFDLSCTRKMSLNFGHSSNVRTEWEREKDLRYQRRRDASIKAWQKREREREMRYMQ